MEWTKVQSDVWNPEPGDQLEGVYLGVERDVGVNHSNLYKIETEPGKVMSMWGSKIIDDAMFSVKVGQQVKIKFNGIVKPPKGNEYKSFEVFVKPM